ncbi:Protein of unknown function [Bacillus wiedmannii]
MKNDG